MPKQRTWDDFVRAWLSSSSVREVAQRTGLTPSTCQVYAVRLRRLGVKLPGMKGRTLGGLDVNALNRIIEEGDE